MDVLRKIERVDTDGNDKPVLGQTVVIASCGVVERTQTSVASQINVWIISVFCYAVTALCIYISHLSFRIIVLYKYLYANESVHILCVMFVHTYENMY